MWIKGFLQEDGKVGDTVTIRTACGRLETGTLVELGPYYTHSYGGFVPEIVEIDRRIREIMKGGEE